MKTPLLLGCKGCGSAIAEGCCPSIRWDRCRRCDDATKWVADDAGPRLLRESTDRHRVALLQQMEKAAGSPWFLGARFSAIGLYIAVMTRWRPGRKVLAAQVPALMAIAERAAGLPAVQPVIARNFG